MRSNVPAFAPGGPTVTVSASSTNSIAKFNPQKSCPHVRIYNAGSGLVFVVFNDTTQAVSSTGIGVPIASGVTEVLGCNTQLAAGIICASGITATVYLTPGEGI